MSLEGLHIAHEVNSNEFNREKIKELLEQKVEGKVQIIHELWSLVEENKELQADEFVDKIELMQEKIFACFEGDVEQKLQEYQGSIRDLYHMPSEEESLIDEYETRFGENEFYEREDYIKEIQDLEEKKEALRKKVSELGADDDIKFLKKVDDFTKNITEKIYEVEDEKEFFDKLGKDQFLSTLSDTYFEDITEKEIEQSKVLFAGHCVNIVLPKEAYQRNYPRTGGIHFGGSTYNLICDGTQKEKTIAHEEKHNLTESFVKDIKYSKHLIRELGNEFKRLNTLKEMEAPDSLIENAVQRIQTKIDTYHLENLDEIIADMDELPKECIRNYFIQFSKTIDILDSYIKKIPEDELKGGLYESVNTVKEKFITHIQKLADIYFVSENTDTLENTKGAMILFGHNLPKAERYVKSKVGKKKYNVMKSLRPLNKEGSTYFSNIKLSPGTRVIVDVFGEGLTRSQEIIRRLLEGDKSFFHL